MKLVKINIVVLLIVVIILIIFNRNSNSPIDDKKLTKKYSSLIISGIEYRIDSMPDIPIIKFDSLSIRKRKIGPFILGGWNELFISGLEIGVNYKNSINEKNNSFVNDRIKIIISEISSTVNVKFSNAVISPIKIYSFYPKKKLKMYAEKASSITKNTIKLEKLKFFRENEKLDYFKEAILNITNNEFIVDGESHDFTTFIFK